MSRDALVTIVALIVAVMWSVATVAAILLRDPAILVIVTPIMGSLAYFLFRAKNGKGDHA